MFIAGYGWCLLLVVPLTGLLIVLNWLPDFILSELLRAVLLTGLYCVLRFRVWLLLDLWWLFLYGAEGWGGRNWFGWFVLLMLLLVFVSLVFGGLPVCFVFCWLGC